jgi:AraC-like DNA-binding protein
MAVAGAIEYQLSSADLVAELAMRTTLDGVDENPWPGLEFYRFTEPTDPRWEQAKPLSIGILAQGSGTAGNYAYDTFTCVVVGHRRGGLCRPFRASPEQPCLCFVLEVDPHLISRVSADSQLCERPFRPGDQGDECVVSSLDGLLMSSVVRFLRSLSVVSERRVLAPLYLQEMVYRVLQRDEHAQLVHLAAQQMTEASIAAALDYIATHLAEPLTVTDLARQVNLSSSAFTRLFREATGRSPYQFVKEARLTRARDLLDDGRLGVTEVSHHVGYPSLSHFIKAFRNRFGATPGEHLGTRRGRAERNPATAGAL